MSKHLLMSLQRSQNDRVLALLMERGYDVAVRHDAVTQALRDAANASGANIVPLDLAPSQSNSEKARRRCNQISQELPNLVQGRADVNAFGEKAIVQTVMHSLQERLETSMRLVDALDDLRDSYPRMSVLVNETDLHSARTAVLWARRHGAPSFLISSRANLGDPTTVTRKMLADNVFVFGERAMQPYLDIGVAADRITVTGNPGWDHYGEVLKRRGHYRSEVFSTLNLRAGAPLIIFATTGNAKLSALHGSELYEQTVRVFLRACKALRDRGEVLNVVIKDLPNKQGRGVVNRVAGEELFDEYTYVDGDLPVYLCAADALVGYDASVFVEAMMAGVAAVNIWRPSSWLLGPAMDSRDGVPMISHDDSSGLANILRSILNEPATKLRLTGNQKKRFPFFHVPPDGRSAERCANEIVKRLETV